MWHFPKVLLIYIFSGIFLVFGQFGNVSAGERVVIPQIPKALAAAEKGHAELMRRNHMDLMIHKRDQTDLSLSSRLLPLLHSHIR